MPGITASLISNYSPMFGVVEASLGDGETSDDTVEDVPDTPKPKHDNDKDGTSDDQDTDDDNDGAHDRDDTDDDNDNTPDHQDTDDDNDTIPDDTDTDDDNDNLPDDQDTDDDNDTILDEDQDDIPTPTPIPTPADDNATIPDEDDTIPTPIPTPSDDNGTTPVPIPTDGNATQQNITQVNGTDDGPCNPLSGRECATLWITTVLRANCGIWHPCDSNFNNDGYITMKNAFGSTFFTPATKTREGTAHFSVGIPVGSWYQISVEDGWHTKAYYFDQGYMTGDCHSPGPNGEKNYCKSVMSASGHFMVVNLYYGCRDTWC